MTRQCTGTALGALMACTLLNACERSTSTGMTADLQAASLDPALCSPSRGGFSVTSNNPYFPIHSGSRWFYAGVENGEVIDLRISVLKKTESVAGVTTRIIEERETVGGELSEVSRNFFVQASDGTVCYFGEEVDIYENGKIVAHEGAWRADQPGNRPGIIMPSDPQPGAMFQIEGAPGIAEDEGTIVGTGPVTVPAGSFRESIRVLEFNPLDRSKSFKTYAAGVGLVVDGPVALVAYNP